MSNQEKDWWNKIAPIEENDIDDEFINRQLRWLEINRNLDSIETILDIGGATGSFSIPLAKKGYKVTHFDISPKMLELAKEKASGINNIEFIEGLAQDLSMFPDKHFDLVINFDGPISFSGYDWSKVLSESCRVTKKKLIITVSNKACMIPTWIKYSLKASNKLLPAVYEMMENGFWHKDQFPENQEIYQKSCNITSLKAFSIDEIRQELTNNKMNVLKAKSIGSLSHLYLLHTDDDQKNKYFADKENADQFIDLCEKYDDQIMTEGPGSFRRAGLIAVCEPINFTL